MSNTGSNFEVIGILLGLELRKRKTTQEKIAIHLAAWSCRRLKFTGRVSGGFFGLTATTFARLTPETLSFRFSCARKRTLCSMVSVSITVTGDAVAAS